MKLIPVQNRKPNAKVLLQGHSGSGKSYSALLLAYALCGAYEKVVVIETCHKAAYHYSYLGAFNTLNLHPPYTPEKFIDAIELCEQSGVEAVIIDSLSAEWVGLGGMVERCMEEGDCCSIWHNSLMDTIERSFCHIIATIQLFDDRVVETNEQGEDEVKRVPTISQNEDVYYHFHTALALNSRYQLSIVKDRTAFFLEHPGEVITERLAGEFAQWCAAPDRKIDDWLQQRINACLSIGELLELMHQTEIDNGATFQAFVRRRHELERKLDENPVFTSNREYSNAPGHRA
jgi:energy-coupling factor transporter ATP-binding protein EcfA2